jgi:regulator of PEP synthase PpsR (kinase-PPPase family)
MSEVQQIPIPLSSYLNLIQRKESPYYDLIRHIIQDMEKSYRKSGPPHGVIYTINPRQLKEEIDEKIPNKKLTPINISRTILALLYGSELQKDEDYYTTTSSGGRKNYHIKVNMNNLSTLQMNL